jgi:hypothetical protein
LKTTAVVAEVVNSLQPDEDDYSDMPDRQGFRMWRKGGKWAKAYHGPLANGGIRKWFLIWIYRYIPAMP